MGAVIEVKYFNSFVLKKISNAGNEIIWNGSFGYPDTLPGGFPVTGAAGGGIDENWAIEEARINGGFNNTSTDYGAKAYLVEEEPAGYIRFNAMIYSGIFNSRTGINRTNVFSTGEDIEKATDPANGSIQKLYAEDTNLNIFQELKINRALIDKDAIYSAEGGGAVTSSNVVIGAIQPYNGKYGISKNPESFAVYGTNKYFTDKSNNVVLSLRGGGIVEISQLGMRDFFRDKLNELDINNILGKAVGGWDIYNQQYVLSLQQKDGIKSSDTEFNTLSYDETVQGWTSLFDYRPDQMFSLRNNFYSTTASSLYKHYSTNVPRNQFYDVIYDSTITVVFNPEPLRSKTFSTVEYEGSNGWELTSLISDETGKDENISSSFELFIDQTNSIPSYYGGEYVFNPVGGAVVNAVAGLPPVYGAGYTAVFGTNNPPLERYNAGFSRKENKYVANVINNSNVMNREVIFGNQISGIKGYYTTATFSTDQVTDKGGLKTLFSVGSKFDSTNGY